jgi:hypothetical protein
VSEQTLKKCLHFLGLPDLGFGLKSREICRDRKRLVSQPQAGEPNQQALTSILASNQIQTKTVAQCVEFYYTYKKQVKIGRNGTLTFGDVDTSDEKSAQEEVEVDIKVTPFPTSAASSLARGGSRARVSWEPS